MEATVQVNVVTAEHVARVALLAAGNLRYYTWDDDVIEAKARMLATKALEEFARLVVMDSTQLDSEERELRW